MYNIKAVSKILDMPTVTIRSWETRYQAITPERTESGHRVYTEENLNDLKWLKKQIQENGLNITFVQDNQSMSVKGVVRGLHFQKQFPQTKLVHVIRGAVFDAVVDVRPGSATFGQWFGIELSAENKKQLLIPRGFAHGFLVLTDDAEFCYKCDDFYHPGDEGGIAWNDPDIGIAWPLIEGEYDGSPSAEGYTIDDKPIILSDKDQRWKTLKETF